MRLHQELVLGVGGVRVLRALGIEPAVWHLNEGHSAFLLAERARELVAAGDALEAAWDKVRRDSVFTIHTPVSAGNERFASDLVRRLAGPLLDGDGRPATGGVPVDRVLELGLGPEGDRSIFDMTGFSLRLTHDANAVSQLHAETADATWQGISPHRIRGVTNGIHVPTWIGNAVREHARPRARREPRRPRPGRRDRPASGTASADVPTDGPVGDPPAARSSSWRSSPGAGCGVQFARHGESPGVLEELETALDPEILTIGFARRFATYKRAGLLFSDLDRLSRILWNEERPVQIVFAGKAHPADRPGQQVIQEIFTRSRSDKLRGRVFILEDYDMRVARYPRRRASTSG